MDSNCNYNACDGKLYLGFDLSTQQLKSVIVNQQLEIVYEASVQFDTDLPEFRTQGGVHRHQDPNVVTAPVHMWVKAIDMVLDKLKKAGVNLSEIRVVCGSGQQHGSVFWKKGASSILRNLNSNHTLEEQLQSCFSLKNSPVWMDSSTGTECRILEDSVGGNEALAQITGSRAYERFTGNQILKVRRKDPHTYENTERISLVSSFVASLFLGKYAPIDYSDGSGMNLLDVSTRTWHDTLIDCVSTDLRDKLGEPTPSGHPIDKVSSYFVQRYGFRKDCVVAAFTGDNPASLVGMCLQEGDIAVSLGTSDTVFLTLKEHKPHLTGHILCHPLLKNSYMALLCYKNGSMTRERIANNTADGDWIRFSDILDSTPRGNFGNIGFYFDLQETYPLVSGDFRFNKSDEAVPSFSKEIEVRACVEGQFLRLRTHAEDLGYHTTSKTRILATGGASANMSILQVLADVFNAKVFVQQRPNSAAIGGAFLARFADKTSEKDVQELLSKVSSYSLAAAPALDAEKIYNPMVKRYRSLEQVIQNKKIHTVS